MVGMVEVVALGLLVALSVAMAAFVAVAVAVPALPAYDYGSHVQQRYIVIDELYYYSRQIVNVKDGSKQNKLYLYLPSAVANGPDDADCGSCPFPRTYAGRI